MLLQEDQSFADADHGILQPARMWKVGRSQNADLFRLEQRRNSLDFVVDILVDASGSQRPRQENVTLQTYILAETLSRLHIPFRVMSFCTFWDYTILHRMRDYDDPRRRTAIFLSISHPQTTAMGLLSRRRGWIFKTPGGPEAADSLKRRKAVRCAGEPAECEKSKAVPG